MKLGDSIQLLVITTQMLDNGDVIEDTHYEPLGKGKCIILPNGDSKESEGEDGEAYSTSYEVMMKKPSSIPQKGSVVHITKEDKSIDCDCKVSGFVTMKSWLKLWLR